MILLSLLCVAWLRCQSLAEVGVANLLLSPVRCSSFLVSNFLAPGDPNFPCSPNFPDSPLQLFTELNLDLASLFHGAPFFPWYLEELFLPSLQFVDSFVVVAAAVAVVALF